MIRLFNHSMVIPLKIYVVITLLIATILSPLALSFIPILILVWYLYLWRWSVTVVINLLTEYFMIFAVSLLLSSHFGPQFSLLISLPLLFLINHDLQEVAGSIDLKSSRYIRRPTDICLTLLIIVIVMLGVSLLVDSISLLLSCVAIISYFGILGTIVLRRLPLKPVEGEQIQQRMVAGSQKKLHIKLSSRTKIGGLLFVESPYEWLKVNPDIVSLKENELTVKVSLSPDLSGPSIIKLKGKATDRWGLIQVSFEMEPISLYVIPRARYAAWLAKRYLAGTKPGTLPLISNMEALKPIYGLRRGVEYYGSQLYQPGDSLKNIDWKQSYKYNELITKEFSEFHGQSAIILINLTTGNVVEADKLAYNIIATALTLARENIPAALAIYNHKGVEITTPILPPQQLLLQSLKVSKKIVIFVEPVKYLSPPDVARLRANISRLRFVESTASRVLSQLLQLEYKKLSNNVKHHPATKALTEAFTKVDKQSNIVIISHRNHDAEAIAFHTFSLNRKGNAVLSV